jgi:hypothetical protein
MKATPTRCKVTPIYTTLAILTLISPYCDVIALHSEGEITPPATSQTSAQSCAPAYGRF